MRKWIDSAYPYACLLLVLLIPIVFVYTASVVARRAEQRKLASISAEIASQTTWDNKEPEVSDADKYYALHTAPWNCYDIATALEHQGDCLSPTSGESLVVSVLRKKAEAKHLRWLVYYAGDRYFASAKHDSEPVTAAYKEDGRLPFWFTWGTSQHKAAALLIKLIDGPENEQPRSRPDKEHVPPACRFDITGGKDVTQQYEKDPFDTCHKRDLP